MHFGILGPLEVVQGGRQVKLGGARQRLLVARLVVSTNRVVSVDSLLDDLSGGDPAPGAKDALQAQVSRARRALGDPTRLVTRPPGYLLRVEVDELDAARFEALLADARRTAGRGDKSGAAGLLGRAEDLWRGPALAEFFDYPFAQAAGARLDELRVAAIEDRVEAELALGRHSGLAPELEGLVTTYPFRERLWAQWMLALYRCGRQVEALRAFARLRQRLIEDLGIEPGTEAARMEEAILSQRPQLDWVAPAATGHVVSNLGSAVQTGLSGAEAKLRSPTLIGRSREQAVLADLWGAAVDGGGSVAVVAGEAGVGKSRLVGELVEHVAAAGAVVLVGGCTDFGGAETPYGPLAEAFRRHLRTLDAAAAAELVRASGGALGTVLPELGDDGVRLSNPARLHGLLLEVMGRMAASTPTLVVLEDLHWGDESTAMVLEFLARNLGNESLLIVATLRHDEVTPTKRQRRLLAALERCPSVRRLDLGPLADAEVAELVTAIVGVPPDAKLVASVVARADGNPLFVEELVASYAVGADLRPTLRALLETRFETLDEPAASCARILAVGKRTLSHALLAETTPLAPDDLLTAVRQAVERHVVVVDQDGYRFHHALVGEALYHQLLPGERAALHARVASALVALPSEGSPAEVAHHWFAAGEWGQALVATLRAAEVAMRSLGASEALPFYQRALELWPRVPDASERTGSDRASILEATAHAATFADTANYALSGGASYLRAIEFARGAVDEIGDDREPVRAGLLHARLGFYLWSSGKDGGVHSELALRLIPAQPESVERARVLSWYARGLTNGCRYDAALPLASEALELAERLEAKEVEVEARITLGTAIGVLGDVETGRARLEEAISSAEEAGFVDAVMRALTNLGLVLDHNDHLEEAFAHLARGADLAHKLGFEEYWTPLRHAHTASYLYLTGKWDECDQLLAELAPSADSIPDVCVWRAFLAAARGDAAAVTAATDKLRAVTEDTGLDAVWIRVPQADLALWLGRPADARAAVDAGLQALGSRQDPEVVSMLCLLGIGAEVACADHGRRNGCSHEVDQALNRVEPLLDQMRSLASSSTVTPPNAARAATAEAELEMLEGRGGLTAWRAAVTAWQATTQPYALARAQWRAASALLACEDSEDEAGSLARASRSTAERLRLTPLRAQLDAMANRHRDSAKFWAAYRNEP